MPTDARIGRRRLPGLSDRLAIVPWLTQRGLFLDTHRTVPRHRPCADWNGVRSLVQK